MGVSHEMLRELLEGQLLMFRLFLLVFPLMILLLVAVVFGQEGQKRVPVFPLVEPGVLHKLIQLDQVSDPEVDTLPQHPAGTQDGGQA